jgi:hypothetical protein
MAAVGADGGLERVRWESLFVLSGAENEIRSCPDHPWSALHIAAMLGDIEAVKGLLQFIPASCCAGCSKRTAFVAAVKMGQLETAKVCVLFFESFFFSLMALLQLLWEAGGQSSGQVMVPLKLLSFALRSGSASLVKWLRCNCESESVAAASSEQLFKLATTVLQLSPRVRVAIAVELCDTAKITSATLACAAARGCDDILSALFGRGLKKRRAKCCCFFLLSGSVFEQVARCCWKRITRTC